MLIRVTGCRDCPFFYRPHCHLLYLTTKGYGRVMGKRDPAPVYPPRLCPLLRSNVTVELLRGSP
jgi:hypothetical protein